MAALSTDRVAANLARVRERIAQAATRVGRDPAEIDVLAAVKYLAATELDTLADAGVTLVGENRAQDLIGKVGFAQGRLRWHFIGALQSRKIKLIVPHVELIHSVASDSVLRELGAHAPPSRRVHRPLSGDGGRVDDDASCNRRPAAQPALLRTARAARARAGAAARIRRHQPGFRGRRRGGSDDRADRHKPVPLNERCRYSVD
jgi:hypothetical protein